MASQFPSTDSCAASISSKWNSHLVDVEAAVGADRRHDERSNAGLRLCRSGHHIEDDEHGIGIDRAGDRNDAEYATLVVQCNDEGVVVAA